MCYRWMALQAVHIKWHGIVALKHSCSIPTSREPILEGVIIYIFFLICDHKPTIALWVNLFVYLRYPTYHRYNKGIETLDSSTSNRNRKTSIVKKILWFIFLFYSRNPLLTDDCDRRTMKPLPAPFW